jgi:acyl-coenzyme A synthetase/AMP-(fatty) acid ligase
MACVLAARSLPPAECSAAARDLLRHCLERLAYFKAPGWVAFCDALPLTATQKIQRADLKALARRCLDSGDCIDTRGMKKRQG